MKFGVREIVDVVFKAAANGQRIGDKTFRKYQPVFMIDTATTSSLEQATTTVYAQGGKGYARLIAWEGEKTMTFTVTDALMSPMGLAVLTGAGLITPNKENQAHVHTTLNVVTDGEGKAKVSLSELNEEFGLDADDYSVCKTIEMFATELDGSGAGINWFTDVTVAGGDDGDLADYVHVVEGAPAEFTVPGAINTTVQLDFYTIMNNSVTEVQIEPGSFGGYFYVEAQTLFRREDTGKDMAAEIIIPKAKVQSAFTFTMAASGDPSTFDFVMDAFPGYTRFDSTKKQMCVIQIVGTDDKAADDTGAHTHENAAEKDSPSFYLDVTANKVAKVADDVNKTESQANQDKLKISKSGNKITVAVNGGVDSLNEFASTNPAQGSGKWIGLDINTGERDITKVTYNGTLLTDDDVAEAESINLPAGHFVLWLKAEVVKDIPRTIVLGTEGKDDTPITIEVEDAA